MALVPNGTARWGHGYLARAVLDHRAEQELGRGPVGGLAVSLWKE